jgi:muconate cycloisomerase
LRLETDGGAVGWGEARALPSWTGETIESIVAALQNYFAPVLLGLNPFARNRMMATLDEIITGDGALGMPSAKSAIDMALYDLQGKLCGVAVHELFGGKSRDRIPLSQSVRADSPAAMKEVALRHADAACLKVKITGDPNLDAERLAAVSEAAPRASIWLDANQNYSPTTVMWLLERIRSVRRVACLQQPVPSQDWLGMARLRERSPLPLAIDEGCYSEQDIVRLSRLGVTDLVVLKLCKHGGLMQTLRVAQLAKNVGLDLLGSGLTESGLGLAAAVHVFSTLQLRLPPQLNGPQFLEDMCVSGLTYHNHTGIDVPSSPGLGVEVDEERLRRYVLDL